MYGIAFAVSFTRVRSTYGQFHCLTEGKIEHVIDTGVITYSG